ncbi:cytochrome C oxidase copper chaperone-domain-containing protein [Schizothecium vesticola]|uniref:Cytochrome C oxidase copper chaperone-domain-containing protein n=1 Tax=Schizothecium vesticola TaxID=314040 RepID=A0AA40FAR6_9PEZI|nr:cytochrome C oxidase copper chaperone-domain-containing protein [Schizothecium vesticola]
MASPAASLRSFRPPCRLPVHLPVNIGLTFSSLAAATAQAPPRPAAAAAQTIDKPKPCCVCKDEKAARDDCMLFSKAADPMTDCQGTIDLYKSCMLGFGFKI